MLFIEEIVGCYLDCIFGVFRFSNFCWLGVGMRGSFCYGCGVIVVILWIRYLVFIDLDEVAMVVVCLVVGEIIFVIGGGLSCIEVLSFIIGDFVFLLLLSDF